jgi:hypothetical protein
VKCVERDDTSTPPSNEREIVKRESCLPHYHLGYPLRAATVICITDRCRSSVDHDPVNSLAFSKSCRELTEDLHTCSEEEWNLVAANP